MAFPRSFYDDGFVTERPKRPRLLVGSEGETNTGKTEFILSAPPPGVLVAAERGHEAALDNATPPPTRNPDFAIVPVKIPGALTYDDAAPYVEHWRNLRKTLYKALDNKDALSVGFDGDSDSWELQRLAAFGTTTHIPPILYTAVNSARRLLIQHCYDSGKNVIMTNKVKASYMDDFDSAGNPKLNNDGTPKRVKSGEFERQGFNDYEYLYQVQIKHLYKPAESTDLSTLTPKERLAALRNGGGHKPQQWGIEVLRCKTKREIEGTQLWGDKCNFKGLVELIYHHREPTWYAPCLCLNCADWGF